jgi:predicted O-linked N-acetylglucosamine transferase (SPINDLY family)
MLCNQDTVLEGEDKFYLEKPFRLSGPYAPFTPPQEEIMVEEAPCSRNGYVTFGCFNNFMKINSETLKLWIEILKQVPNSKLYLKNEMFKDKLFQERIKEKFNTAGIKSDRLIFEEYVHNKKSYIVEYNKVDIALDPIPLGGGTTTNDLLWMGTPLITLYGKRISQRSSASILKQIGAEELISYSEQEYIDKAVKLGQDYNLIDRYKRSLRDKYVSSDICNKEKFAKELLRAFSVMWHETLSKNP